MLRPSTIGLDCDLFDRPRCGLENVLHIPVT
jgi:hypothetical protein